MLGDLNGRPSSRRPTPSRRSGKPPFSRMHAVPHHLLQGSSRLNPDSLQGMALLSRRPIVVLFVRSADKHFRLTDTHGLSRTKRKRNQEGRNHGASHRSQILPCASQTVVKRPLVDDRL
jgi:ribosomal protein L35